MGFVLMAVGAGLLALCNGIWYQGKSVLQEKGYPASLFWDHLRDFPMMDRAISEETDPEEIERLRAIRKRMGAIWIIFPIAAAVFFLGAFLGPLTG